MNTYQFENGDRYEYNPEDFERFYKEYKAVMRGIRIFEKSDLLRKWVKAHGTRIPKVEIKKGDFVVAFSKDGRFSFSGFANGTVFNANGTVFNAGIELWKTEDGYVFNPDHQRLFICKSGLLVIPKLEGEALSAKHFIPRTIEEAESFCQEVTG